MIKRVQWRVISKKRREGISEKRNSLTAAASASKLSKVVDKLLGGKKSEGDSSTDDKKSKGIQTSQEAYESAFAKGAEYTTNDGPTSKLIVADYTVDMLYDNKEDPATFKKDILIKAANGMTQFEAFVGDDIHTKKIESRKQKLQINADFYAKYGGSYNDPLVIQRQEKQLLACSFTYTKHQFVVAIESDEPIMELTNCLNKNQSDSAAGRYIYEIKSRVLYQLGYVKLTQTHIDALLGVSEDKVIKMKLSRLPYKVELVPKTDSEGNIVAIIYRRVGKQSDESMV